MRIYFSAKVSLIGLVLIAIFLRLAYWQWTRHLEKRVTIVALEARLKQPLGDLALLLNNSKPNWDELFYRRFHVVGEYDFQHEVVMRNRMYEQNAGVHVLTPLRIAGSDRYILVNRGFIPLEQAAREKRTIFQRSSTADFLGLIKEGRPAKFLAPPDEKPQPGKWVDSWLRVDPAEMQKQLPYQLLPAYVEVMSITDPKQVEGLVVKADSGREDLLFLGLKDASGQERKLLPIGNYPLPVFDTIIPAARHLGYVYEWSFMALATFLICLILQLRPRGGNFAEAS